MIHSKNLASEPIFLILFQSEVSRPNSIYNLSGPPTDVEGGLRPHSALTSYSNFHGQRQQPVLSTPANAEFSVKQETAVLPPPQNITNLTQESLMNVSFVILNITLYMSSYIFYSASLN